MTVQDAPADALELPPGEDGRTRCAWVAGRPAHYAFHDADWGFVPDDETMCRERLVLTCFQRDLPLADVLDHRAELVEAFQNYDFAKIAAMDDAALDALARRGGVLGDRARLAWVRDVCAAGAETAKASKDFREYLLAARFLPPEELFADLTARFPGFTRIDAARFAENAGLMEMKATAHDRDCWRA